MSAPILMTDNIIERAARGLGKLIGLDDEASIEALRNVEINGSETDLFDFARAVLDAMREPSKAMLNEGSDIADCEVGSMETAWQAMIDAALEENDGTK